MAQLIMSRPPQRNRKALRVALCALLCAFSLYPAISSAQEAQPLSTTQFQSLGQLFAMVEAVRYESPNTARPSVVIYALVQNRGAVPLVLTEATFAGSILTTGSRNIGVNRYWFPADRAAGGPETFVQRSLGPGQSARLAFRHDSENPLEGGTLTWTLRHRPLLRFGRERGGEMTVNIPRYVGTLKEEELATPPAQAMENSGQGVFRGVTAFQPIGQWRARVDSVAYGSANPETRPGAGLTVIRLTLQNTSTGELRLNPSSLRATIVEAGGRTTPHHHESVQAKGRLVFEEFAVPSGDYVYVVLSFYLADAAAQAQARRWTLTLPQADGQPVSLSGDLPRLTVPAPAPETTPPPPPPPPPPAEPYVRPTYGDPAMPAPNLSAEAAMRALQGAYVYNEIGTLTLAYAGGRLTGEARGAGGAPAPVTLTMNDQGRLIGVMRQPDALPDATWFMIDLTPSFDRSRLEGSATYVHRGASPPLVFRARRAAPPQTERPNDPPPSGAGGGVQTLPTTAAFQPTRYFEMRVERVGRIPDGSVEVVLVARNTAQERRGAPYDPQTFSLEGSDGFEYRSDGNIYGQSAADRPGSTDWIEPGAQKRVTYVFSGVPSGVDPARLIVRENGAQTASFALAR